MAANYRVVAQRQTTDLGADGTFVDVMEVTFSTIPNSIVGKVRVPVAEYGPERVRAEIDERVAAILDVHSL